MRFLPALFSASVLAASLLVSGCATAPAPAAKPPAGPEGVFAEITTPRGVITCELFYRQAPLTVARQRVRGHEKIENRGHDRSWLNADRF